MRFIIIKNAVVLALPVAVFIAAFLSDRNTTGMLTGGLLFAVLLVKAVLEIREVRRRHLSS